MFPKVLDLEKTLFNKNKVKNSNKFKSIWKIEYSKDVIRRIEKTNYKNVERDDKDIWES